MDWPKIKKLIKDWAPYVLKFIVDQIVKVIVFIKKEIVYAIRQVFKG
jgi:hypothetical protein